MASAIPAPGVDKKDVAKFDHCRNGPVAMHYCQDVFDYAGVAEVVSIRRPKASSCRAAHSGQPVQIKGVHLLPVVKRAVGVHQSNDAGRCLNFKRKGQGGEALANAFELVAGEIVEPFTAMEKVVDFMEGQAQGAARGHQVMIA